MTKPISRPVSSPKITKKGNIDIGIDININEYVQWTGRTCAGLETKQLDNIHMLFSITSTIGKLMDMYNKNLAYGEKINPIFVREKIGESMYFLASFCRINDFDLDKIIGVNVAKLISRYPEKFDKWNATNRNLDKERDILKRGYKGKYDSAEWERRNHI